MDLVILIVLIVIVVCAYKDIKFVTYLLGILEIFFRIMHYLGDNLPIIGLILLLMFIFQLRYFRLLISILLVL